VAREPLQIKLMLVSEFTDLKKDLVVTHRMGSRHHFSPDNQISRVVLIVIYILEPS
jgi:hypothetical protein